MYDDEKPNVINLGRYSYQLRGDTHIRIARIVIDSLIVLAVIIALWMALMPRYSVWSSHMEGEATLAKATADRQVTIQDALSKKAAAVYLAAAEKERAKGVAAANEIIGNSLKDNESYLRYLWIDSLDKTKGQVIYVPTEGNLPILEANRLNPVTRPQQ